MVTATEGLSADELPTASDPISLRQHFWDALAVADESLAVDAANRVRPPAVAMDTFDFENVDDVAAHEDSEEGRLVLPVEPGSPGTVLNAWNKRDKTTLVELDFAKMCLVRNPTDKFERGAGKKDFRACVKVGCQLVSHRGPEEGGADVKFKLHPPADHTGSVLAVRVVPSNPGQQLETVFSRPLFYMDELPPIPEGVEDTRLDILLRLNLKSVVFKFLIEGYPGKHEMTSRLQFKGVLPSLAVMFSTPRTSESAAGTSGREEVLKSPGLQAIVTDFDEVRRRGDTSNQDDSSSQVEEVYDETAQERRSFSTRHPTTPVGSSSTYPWNREISSSTPARGGVSFGDDLSMNSLSSVGVMSRSVEISINRLQEKLNTLTKNFNNFRKETAQKDADLGNVIYKLRVSESVSKQEISDLRELVEDLSAHMSMSDRGGLHDRRPSFASLNTSDKKEIHDDLVKTLGLDKFVRKSDISNMVAKSDLDSFVKFRDLADYAKVSVLTDYVSATQLSNYGFATAVDLERSMTELGIPDRLLERFTSLEREVIDPGGLVRTLEQSIKDLSDKKGGSEVSMGGVSFKDQYVTEGWTSLLGDGDSIIAYACDMVIQVLGLANTLTTSAEVTQATANAIKAGFTSSTSASIHASFSLQFPETVFRPSQKAKDIGKGGVTFAPAFSSPEAFEGNAEFSAKTQMLSTLSNNRERHQRSIDARFPRDQPKHVKPNAVFSALLRLGYFQAVGFLESLLPFHKMMTDAGLGVEEAWGKCLTYARAVFARIYEVRTVASVHTAGSMLYGMMRSTQMLQAYGELGWIRHPDVSSALVVAALQKEGKAVTEALAKAKAKDPQVATNKSNISSLENRFKELLKKNPTLSS